MTGTPQQKHLEKIEDDQSIQGIGTIDDTIRNDAGRKWFVSQAINAGVCMATYDPRTGRITLGATPIPTTASTVSAALNTPSVTLTCPAGHAYKVLWAGGDNNTTAGTWRVIYTPSGGTATQLFDSATQVCAINVTAQLIGSSAGFTAAATVNIGGPAGPIWMRSGDTLNIENTNDVAGDTITIAFLYEDYIVG